MAATPVQAWPFLVEPERVGTWFGRPDRAFETGAQVVLTFTLDDGSTQLGNAQVVEVREHEYVSFHWLPGPASRWEGVLDRGAPLADLPTTLVELHLAPTADGRSSTIRVVESGFAALPEQVAAAILGDNTGGWKHCFDQLEAQLAAQPVGG